MSRDEMQQKMEFIVNQQAQFATDFQKVHETRGKLADAIVGAVGMIGNLIESQTQLTAQMRELAQAQRRTDEKLAALTRAPCPREDCNNFLQVFFLCDSLTAF